ncbi:MAG TPA: diaminopimelate epimerase [Acidobacteriota bacterium]|jgi:diaminopimelate epimerase|nr:diaminopimelate epimerase [Acidobacteriota bacterium]
MIKASKYHGYGNDFIIVPPGQTEESRYPALAKAICDRHFGIGADGCVFLQEGEGERFPIRIFNQDGSEAGMSGNGTRCAAAYVHHQEVSSGDEIVFLTASGAKSYCLIESSFPVWRYKSQMGVPGFSPSKIPFIAPDGLESIQNHEVAVGRHMVRINALWVGNPQCAVFVEELPSDDLFDQLGSGLSLHPSFPQGTNVSFVLPTGPQSLKIRIWERGVGPTHSSGTGSCGAAIAALVEGRVQSPVEVQTTTGTQVVEWGPGREILLTGEACFVADAEICLT